MKCISKVPIYIGLNSKRVGLLAQMYLFEFCFPSHRKWQCEQAEEGELEEGHPDQCYS